MADYSLLERLGIAYEVFIGLGQAPEVADKHIIDEVTITFRDRASDPPIRQIVDVHRYDMLLWGFETKKLMGPVLRRVYRRWERKHPDLARHNERFGIWDRYVAPVGPTPTTMHPQDPMPDPGAVTGPVCVHEWTCNMICC